MGVYRPTTAVSGNTPAEAALLAEFESLLAAGGSETTIVPEIQRVKFGKNMWNAVLGASAALSRFSLREFFRPPHLEPGATSPPAPEPPCAPNTSSEAATAAVPAAAPLLAAHTTPFLYDTLTELSTLGVALFPAAGEVKALDADLPTRTLANTARLHARPDSAHVPSMLGDMLAGRPMEVEHVLGEVVRMARAAGVAVPVSRPRSWEGC